MWDILTEKQRAEYKKHCDSKYGKTFSYCETGEPMYMDKQGNLIDTEITMTLLFSINEN